MGRLPTRNRMFTVKSVIVCQEEEEEEMENDIWEQCYISLYDAVLPNLTNKEYSCIPIKPNEMCHTFQFRFSKIHILQA